MATNREFQDMLNEYLNEDLLREEFIPRTYVLKNIEKDDGWKGGKYVVPFRGAYASSVEYGQLTASNDVASSKYVRGSVDAQIEIWGTMKFNSRDLMEHDKISEQNFLRLLPDEIEDFMDYMKNVVSVNLLVGDHFAKLTADSTANDGIITVDRPDRFTVGQKVLVDDDNSSPATGYVSAIDINNFRVTLVTTRGGATPVDFSANNMTVAQNARTYHPGAQTSAFNSVRKALLSLANGGSAALYGQTKLAYPYLQAINIPGSDITGANILLKVFDALTRYRLLSKGNATEIWCSYKNFGAIVKAVESSKGSFNVVPDSRKTSVYNWQEVTIGSVTGGVIKFVGIQEADDDIIIFMDWRALKFASNGFFRKQRSPDGLEYFVIRNQTGYEYLVDICLFGELIVVRPSYCGIIFGINF